MALTEMDRAFGMRSFAVRGGCREVIFDPHRGWWLHENDRKGRLWRKHALLSFVDVEDQLSDQPNMLADARGVEEAR
jgi:hypothetical protein